MHTLVIVYYYAIVTFHLLAYLPSLYLITISLKEEDTKYCSALIFWHLAQFGSFVSSCSVNIWNKWMNKKWNIFLRFLPLKWFNKKLYFHTLDFWVTWEIEDVTIISFPSFQAWQSTWKSYQRVKHGIWTNVLISVSLKNALITVEEFTCYKPQRQRELELRQQQMRDVNTLSEDGKQMDKWWVT